MTGVCNRNCLNHVWNVIREWFNPFIKILQVILLSCNVCLDCFDICIYGCNERVIWFPLGNQCHRETIKIKFLCCLLFVMVFISSFRSFIFCNGVFLKSDIWFCTWRCLFHHYLLQFRFLNPLMSSFISKLLSILCSNCEKFSSTHVFCRAILSDASTIVGAFMD